MHFPIIYFLKRASGKINKIQTEIKTFMKTKSPFVISIDKNSIKYFKFVLFDRIYFSQINLRLERLPLCRVELV